MRLAGGKRSHEGRVEVYIAGVWGTVCDDGWDIKEAIVVCRHLNFPSAREAVDGGRYGPGMYSMCWCILFVALLLLVYLLFLCVIHVKGFITY